MKYLLIAEKPSLMRTIQDVYKKHRAEIGYDCDFTAQAGHIMRLLQPNELNPEYKKWRRENYPMDLSYKYTVISGKEEMYKKIRDAIRSGAYDGIIHAGDPDQEGELLVRLTLNAVENPLPVRRFWSNDLTENAVLHALEHLEDDKKYDSLYEAALVRQHMDYQYGMNLTGCMTLALGPLVKIGRVKAPIIHIICAREKEIQEFQPHSDYVHEADHKGYAFLGETRYATPEEAKETMPDRFAVTSVSDQTVQRKPGKLYKLSTLQSAASGVYGFSGAKTLSLCQSLYEKQYTSYPRTDCEYLASGTNAEAILKNLAERVLPEGMTLRPTETVKADKSYFNDKAIGSEGHTALIPTGEIPRDMTEDEAKVFDLILRKFVSVFGPMKTVRVVKAEGVSPKKEKFTMSAEDVIDPGFERILNPKYEGKHCSKEKLAEGVCPNGTVSFTVHEIKAKCPGRYTDGSLISALDHPLALSKKLDSGVEEETSQYKIGTPATRSNIIEDCIKTGYFSRKGGKFYAEPLAMTLMKELGWVKIFDLKTTAEWEKDLSLVREKEESPKTVEDSMMKTLTETIDEVKHADVHEMERKGKKVPIGKCPLCGGDVYENLKAFGCSNWKSKNCKFTIWKKSFMGYSVTAADVKKLLAGKTITKNVTSKKGNSWKQELFYNKDTNRIEFYNYGKEK